MKTLLQIILMMAFFWICATGCKSNKLPYSKNDYALKESKRNHYYQSTRKHFLKANK